MLLPSKRRKKLHQEWRLCGCLSSDGCKPRLVRRRSSTLYFIRSFLGNSSRLPLVAVLFWGIEPTLMLCAFLFLCAIPIFWPFAVAYITWLFLDKAPERGGRRFECVRKWSLWKFFADYFPVTIVKVSLFHYYMVLKVFLKVTAH